MSNPTTTTRLDSEVARLLARLVDEYGLEYLCEGGRLEGMLKDHCPDKKREIRLIVLTLREKLAQRMASEMTSTPEVTLLASSSSHLREECGLSEGAARWAVEAWHFALRSDRGDTVTLPPDRHPHPPSTPASVPAPEPMAARTLSEYPPPHRSSPWGWALVGGVLVLAAVAGGWFALSPANNRVVNQLGPPSAGPNGPRSGYVMVDGVAQYMPPAFPPPALLANSIGQQQRVMDMIHEVEHGEADQENVFLVQSSVMLMLGPEVVNSFGGPDAVEKAIDGKYIYAEGKVEAVDASDAKLYDRAKYLIHIDNRNQILHIDKRPPPQSEMPNLR